MGDQMTSSVRTLVTAAKTAIAAVATDCLDVSIALTPDGSVAFPHEWPAARDELIEYIKQHNPTT